VSGVSRQKLGRAGEKAACNYLRQKGYRILARNYTCAAGELDLICRHDDCIVFVEVKTLSDSDAADPESRIGRTKQRQLTRVARYWLAAHGEPDLAYRFDAIGVTLPSGEAPHIRHIPEAFVPSQ
jgi:putative endonuclease